MRKSLADRIEWKSEGRDQTPQPKSTTHAGLWLDKYVRATDKSDKAARSTLVRQVASIATPDIYSKYFETRWQVELKAMGALSRKARVEGRLAIGLGAASLIENGFSIHRTYGVPFIEGSALKGLASRYAHDHMAHDNWRRDGRFHRAIFGGVANDEGGIDEAGGLDFLPALPLPGSGYNNRFLQPDVLTPHHRDYNSGVTGKPPADWDSPTPIPFLSATGTYLVAIAGQPEWCQIAFTILRKALIEEGIGAKTSSGYGRLELLDN